MEGKKVYSTPITGHIIALLVTHIISLILARDYYEAMKAKMIVIKPISVESCTLEILGPQNPQP